MAAKRGREGPKVAQKGPKRNQKGPKWSPFGTLWGARGPQSAPKRPMWAILVHFGHFCTPFWSIFGPFWTTFPRLERSFLHYLSSPLGRPFLHYLSHFSDIYSSWEDISHMYSSAPYDIIVFREPHSLEDPFCTTGPTIHIFTLRRLPTQ